MSIPSIDLPAWTRRPEYRPSFLAAVVLVGVTLWATWSVLCAMAGRWELDPTYSHGYLVPLISLLVFWSRRHSAPEPSTRPQWWALGLFAAGFAMQLAGTYIYFNWLIGASLVVYLAGVVALIGGWPSLRWAIPGLFFLFFMIPLPYRLEAMMRGPLQRISTTASAFALQTVGLSAITRGNIIVLSDSTGHPIELGVVDACSGLKMLIVFFCLTSAFAVLVKRPLGERLLILLSTVPIALICNIARITATGILYVLVGEKWANLVFHDLAGWLMMPMALALLWLELKLLSALFIDDAPSDQPTFRLPTGPQATPLRNASTAH